MSQKTALIVTDGAETTKKIAYMLGAALDGYDARVQTAEAFAGTELLPVAGFFLGCATAQPGSFAYIGEMLQHINLSGRFCGIFATDKKALNYLADLVIDSGAAVGKPLLVKDSGDTAEIQNWVRNIIQGAL